MKISVSSYSFSQAVRDGRLGIMDLIPKAIELGYDGIEFAGLGQLPEGQTEEELAAALAAQAKDLDFPIVAYSTAADLLVGKLEEAVDKVKQQVDIASILGVDKMRHDATYGIPADYIGPKGYSAVLPRLAEGCRQITVYAQQKGIKTMVENHGYFVQESQRVERLVNRVSHPNFGLLVDMGNFLCADDSPATAVGLLAPYAFHAHCKDFHVKSGVDTIPGTGWFGTRGGNYLRGAIVGHGDVPVRQCIRLLKRAGYNGYLTVEFEGIEDCLFGLTDGLKNLRRMMTELEA